MKRISIVVALVALLLASQVHAAGVIGTPVDANGNVKTTLYDGAGNPIAYTNPNPTPLGYQKITVSTSVQGLTVPTGATLAVINPELGGTGATCFFRIRDDGVAPTSTTGLQADNWYMTGLGNSGPMLWRGDLATWQIILDSANPACTNPYIDVLYYR